MGLVGYGMAGRLVHTPLIKAAGLRVAVVATRDPERAAQARTDNPGVEIVDDHRALLARDDVAAVVLASPTGAHAAQALATIDRGLAVVVDKPLATGAHQAAHVVRAAQAAQVLLTVFQNRRYDPVQATLTEAVRAGRLGEIYRAELRWERWRPVPKDRWRESARAEDGGGLMLDLHSHLIDEAIQCFGPIATVWAEVHARTTLAEDDVVLVARHTGGTTSYLSASSVAAAPGPRVRVLGSRAAFVSDGIDGEPPLIAELGDKPGYAGWLQVGAHREPVPALASSQVDFYRQFAVALDSRDPADLPVDPWDAVRTLAVIDAARQSGRSGQVERVHDVRRTLPD